MDVVTCASNANVQRRNVIFCFADGKYDTDDGLRGEPVATFIEKQTSQTELIQTVTYKDLFTPGESQGDVDTLLLLVLTILALYRIS